MSSIPDSRTSSTGGEKDVEKGPNDSGYFSRKPSQAPIRKPSDPPQSTSPSTRITDWDGPEDPENPLNWSKRMKIYHTCIPASMAFVTTLASSIYTPGRDTLSAEFGVSREVSILPYVLYVLGLGFGPLAAAPLSETLGRRAVYMIGIPIFALFILGAGFSNDIAGVCICRFLAGVFGSPGLSIGSATLSDIWVPAERAVPMAIYVTTPFLGPALGPLLGGYSSERFDWRWTEWIILFFTAIFLIPTLWMKETYKSTLLHRRAKARGVEGPAGPNRTTIEAAKFFLTSTLFRPLHMFFVEPVVGLLTMYVGLNFGMLYGFFAAFPLIFHEIYGFNLGEIGLSFLGFGVGAIIGGFIVVILAATVFKRRVVQSFKAGKGGKVPPEMRLYPAMIGAIMLPIGLFWFAWSAQEHVHWICPILSEIFFGMGNFLVFMSATLYMMDFYGPMYGASAMAANTLIRYLIGAAFPLFIEYMYQALGVGWATSLFGFVCVALAVIPFAFYHWGPKLRNMSKYRPAS